MSTPTRTPVPAHVKVTVVENDAFVIGTEVVYTFDEERMVQITGTPQGPWHVLAHDSQFASFRDDTFVDDRAAAEERAARWLQSWDVGLRG